MGFWIILNAYLCGVRDSLRSILIIHKLDQISDEERRKYEEKERELTNPRVTTVLQQRRKAANAGKEKRPVELVAKPKAINGLFYSLTINLLLVLILYVTMPDKNSSWKLILHRSLCIFCVIVSKLCSGIWFSDIANASLKYTGVQTPNIPLSRTIGDFFSAILLDIIFFLQTLFVDSIPVPFISKALCFIQMALLNSLFSFEYLWMSLGIGLRARIRRIERNWPYFLGYGTVLTVLTSLTESMMVNALLFAALFPFCIISSYLVQADSYEQTTLPYVHIFGPSLATTDYVTASLSSMLRSFGNKNAARAQCARTGRLSLRDHHSYSPVRPNKHTRAEHSVE